MFPFNLDSFLGTTYCYGLLAQERKHDPLSCMLIPPSLRNVETFPEIGHCCMLAPDQFVTRH